MPGVIFNNRRKTGRVDLEAVERAVRPAMHQAGAAALAEPLYSPAPAAIRLITGNCAPRRCPLPWGRWKYRVLAGVELDVENTGASAGVRRMLATAGQDAPFDHGRQ